MGVWRGVPCHLSIYFVKRAMSYVSDAYFPHVACQLYTQKKPWSVSVSFLTLLSLWEDPGADPGKRVLGVQDPPIHLQKSFRDT